MRYRVAFIIPQYKNISTGIGGHLRSVREISMAMTAYFDVNVITYGDLSPSIYADYKQHSHIAVTDQQAGTIERRLLSAGELKQALMPMSGEHIIIVAVGSFVGYVVGKKFLRDYKGASCILKPGGKPWANGWIFSSIPMILFSKVDYDLSFKLNMRRPLCLMAERVHKFPEDAAYMSLLRTAIPDSEEPKVLTVCRIDQSKELPLKIIYHYLAKCNKKFEFLHIGKLQTKELMSELKSIVSKNSFQLHDVEFTDDAKQSVHWCDAFCGVGRSAIEALSCGKPVFIPVWFAGDRPELLAVTYDNWKVFSRHNFTSRVSYKEITGKQIGLADALADKDLLLYLGGESKKIYEQFYNPSLAADKMKKFIGELGVYQEPFISSFKTKLFFLLVKLRTIFKSFFLR